MKNMFKFFLIPLMLIIFWLFASISLIYFPPSFSSVANYHSKSDIENFSTDKLLRGHKIEGSFLASENNLGIIFLRFDQLGPVEYGKQDTLSFKIKEKGENNWLAQNSYRSGSIYSYPFFPFGFPVIDDSKGKMYEFEIVSLNGNSSNAVSLSTVKPMFESQYKFSKSEILKDKKSLTHFVLIKLKNFLGNKDAIILSYPYLLPLAIYLIFISRVFIPSKVIFYIVLFGIIADSVIDYKTLYFAGEITLIFAWIFILVKHKLDNSASFSLAALFMVLSVWAIFYNRPLVLQKSSEWTYYLISAGIIQTVVELKNKKWKLISMKDFIMLKGKYDEK